MAAALALALSVPAAARPQGFASAAAGGQALLSVGWELALPLQGLDDAVGRSALRSFQAEVRASPRRAVSLGVAGGWTWLAADRGQGTLQLPAATVGGSLYRRLQLTRALLTAHLYLSRGVVQPYLGGGAGAAWTATYEQVGEVVRRRDDVHVAWEPELGLLWTVGRGLALRGAVAWHVVQARWDSGRRLEWIGLQLGVAAY
jgi:hypothetical protein